MSGLNQINPVDGLLRAPKQQPWRPELMLCDIDRTLLAHDHELLENVRAAAVRLPFPLVLASARSPIGVRDIRQATSAAKISVCFNGAWIGDVETGQALFQEELERDLALTIWQECRRLGGVPAWFTVSCCTAFRADGPVVSKRIRVTGDPLHFVENNSNLPDAPLKLLVTVSEDRIAEVAAMLSAQFQNAATIAQSGATLLEVVGPHVNKGLAAHRVADLFDVGPSKTVAAGDSANDREMLEWAGISMAPANALSGLLECASVIVPSCDQCGMASGFDWLSGLTEKTLSIGT